MNTENKRGKGAFYENWISKIMDSYIIALLIIIALVLALWIRTQIRDQHKLRENTLQSLAHCNALILLVQQRRTLMTDSDKNLAQNELKLLNNNTDIEKHLYMLDSQKSIAKNEYWNALLDHWKRLKTKGFNLSKAVLFQQHSNLIDNLLALQKQRIALPEQQALFAENHWLNECIWWGIPEISEGLYRTRFLKQAIYSRQQPLPTFKQEQFQRHLSDLQHSCDTWLSPLNQKGVALDGNLIIRTSGCCERALRIHQQEMLQIKNSHYSPAALSAIVSEALSNLCTLQQHQIAYLKRSFHPK